jgi:Na+-driven multidrug efflux pump
VWDRLLQRWEALPGMAQFFLSFPVTFVVFFLGHVYLLNQPVEWRGVFYGVFWGLLFSLLIVYASWNEHRKRLMREQEEKEPSQDRDHAPV